MLGGRESRAWAEGWKFPPVFGLSAADKGKGVAAILSDALPKGGGSSAAACLRRVQFKEGPGNFCVFSWTLPVGRRDSPASAQEKKGACDDKSVQGERAVEESQIGVRRSLDENGLRRVRRVVVDRGVFVGEKRAPFGNGLLFGVGAVARPELDSGVAVAFAVGLVDIKRVVAPNASSSSFDLVCAD